MTCETTRRPSKHRIRAIKDSRTIQLHTVHQSVVAYETSQKLTTSVPEQHTLDAEQLNPPMKVVDEHPSPKGAAMLVGLSPSSRSVAAVAGEMFWRCSQIHMKASSEGSLSESVHLGL